jgi:hypothetical protein
MIPIFVTTWISLIFFPPLAYGLSQHVKMHRPKAMRRTIIVATLILVLAYTFAHFGFVLTNVFANVALVAIVYLAWCYLAACSWKIPRKILRFPIAIASHAPIVCGYFAGIIGVGIPFAIADDIARPPIRIESPSSNVSCELSRSGFAANSSSSMILYQHWQFAPFIRRKLARDVAYNLDDEEAMSCTEMLSQYLGS